MKQKNREKVFIKIVISSAEKDGKERSTNQFMSIVRWTIYLCFLYVILVVLAGCTIYKVESPKVSYSLSDSKAFENAECVALPGRGISE